MQPFDTKNFLVNKYFAEVLGHGKSVPTRNLKEHVNITGILLSRTKKSYQFKILCKYCGHQ